MKPLVRGKKIKIGISESIWIKFAYERLPDYYYYYGLLGHGYWECEKWISLKEKDDSEEMSHGQWLQASQIGFKASDFRQHKWLEMGISQPLSTMENVAQNTTVKKSKLMPTIDTKIFSHAKLKELMTYDLFQYTISRDIVFEKS